ncbi:helix-turn-helix domain-containing protein [Streptomyces goshikiensis]|uniref:helix-turn-helix domain-containing protein n=1 Tax=Streptomyces goshikiensis TaxID=1942 RepID=UPI0036AFA445
MTNTEQTRTQDTGTSTEPTGTRRLPRGPKREQLAADLKEKYDAGASIRALAEETGRSYAGVHGLLVEAKTTFRSRGGAHRAPGGNQQN